MNYQTIEKGIFIARPNRFIAEIEIGGKREICHVKNTGRLKELLLPGAVVWCEKSQNPARKTAYDLIAVEHADQVINIDSQAPNKIAADATPRLTTKKLEITKNRVSITQIRYEHSICIFTHLIIQGCKDND